MHRKLVFFGLAVSLIATTAMAVDTTIPAKVGLVKTAKLAKFVAKPATTFPLPSGPTDPSVVGADIKFFDTVAGGGGSFTNSLPAIGWTGLGNPAGVKGFKFKGKALGNPCTIVLIKPTVIKAVCKGVPVTLSTPFLGDDGTTHLDGHVVQPRRCRHSSGGAVAPPNRTPSGELPSRTQRASRTLTGAPPRG